MVELEIGAYIITALFGSIAVVNVIRQCMKNITSIFLNVLFGGVLFTILNILGMKLALNMITGGIITFLGVPGVGLIIILKALFGIF